MIIIRPCVFHVIMRKELINMTQETINQEMFDRIVQTDPTLKLMFESPIDYKLFDWHVTLKCAALMIAMDRFIKLL